MWIHSSLVCLAVLCTLTLAEKTKTSPTSTIKIASQLEDAVLKSAAGSCYEASKAAPGTFDSLLKNRRLPENEKEKCFLGCLYKELGLTSNGGLNVDVAKGIAAVKYSKSPEQHKKALGVLDVCSKSVKNINNECQLGYKTRECLLKNSDPSFTPFFSAT